MEERITSAYLHSLQAVYHLIDRRGISVDIKRLADASAYIDKDITKQCAIVSNIWGVDCYIGSSNKPSSDSTKLSINLNSSSGSNTPLEHLKRLGFKIPKVSARDEDGNYIQKESLNELILQKVYATNQFNTIGGDPAIRAILRIRELGTLRTRYINANLIKRGELAIFLTNYNCAGTVTGRRGSRKHSFGYGGNAQNFPKHGELAKVFRKCLVARPGKILLSVDQMSAEDWPVCALSNNAEGLQELLNCIDRHRKLGGQIFNIPDNHYTDKEWKDSTERYMGKMCRHASNYGMRGNTFSDNLAKNGKSVTPAQCQNILDLVHTLNPSIQQVFHRYLKDQLDASRTLRTPFGRERIFFGLRPGEGGSNNKIYNEAYSYIPQSVVGDNTGFAVHRLETGDESTRGRIIQECHDSIVQEIDDNIDAIWTFTQATKRAFERTIRFYNGIELQIPVEAEIGYDFYHTETFKSRRTGTKKLDDLSYQDIQAAYYKLKEHQQKELENASSTTEHELDISV